MVLQIQRGLIRFCIYFRANFISGSRLSALLRLLFVHIATGSQHCTHFKGENNEEEEEDSQEVL